MKNKAWKLHGKVSLIRHLEELILVQRQKKQIYRFSPESIFFFDALRKPRSASQLIPADRSNSPGIENEVYEFCQSLEGRGILLPSKAVAVAAPQILIFPRLLDSLVGAFVTNIMPPSGPITTQLTVG